MNDSGSAGKAAQTVYTVPARRSVRQAILAASPLFYALVILLVIVGALVYSQRMAGVFACQATGYESDRYLANCQAVKFGDYDHGAFWFGLEPAAISSAAQAEVIFLGNSRTQFGFSSDAISGWFAAHAIPYYLLGFAYNGNYKFEGPLLHRIKPVARAYVINIDQFFESAPSLQAGKVMHDRSEKARHEEKRRWQWLHRMLCTGFPDFCGDNRAFFRSRSNGDWILRGGGRKNKPVSYTDTVNQQVVDAYIAAGKEFLADLPVSRDCIILTMVPIPGTDTRTPQAIADGLGINLVAPRVEGLTTFDASHLDRASSERWSAAFIDAAGPQIRSCTGAS